MRQNGTDSKYYHFDELGSTLFLTDVSCVQTDKYVYNTWGKVVSSSGSTVNPYKYVGRLGYYSDSGTGLLLLGSRFYDPEAGVFTQRDAAKDGLSYYAYTSGKVMTVVDPWGENPVTSIGGTVLVAMCAYKAFICLNTVYGFADKIKKVNDKIAHCYAVCEAQVTCKVSARFISEIIKSPLFEDDPEDKKADDFGVDCAFRIGSDKFGEIQKMFGLYPNCVACCIDKTSDLKIDIGANRRTKFKFHW